jgi:hypothetical protein
MQQGGGAGIPFGWQQVIDGRLPLTRLGKYAYIIGRALKDGHEDIRLSDALDLLACAQILHISFEVDGRWFSTVLLMEFARQQLEGKIGRELDENELRYLSGAVINTLEHADRALLLEPYTSGGEIGELLFQFDDGSVRRFQLDDLPDIAANQLVGINDITKRKAALFWARPDRGIYSRAHRSPGFRFVSALLSVDRALAAAGEPHPLTDMFDAIDRSEPNRGIFAAAEKAFSRDATLFDEWQQFEQRLFDAVNAAAETADTDQMPGVWVDIQRTLRGRPTPVAKATAAAAPAAVADNQQQPYGAEGAVAAPAVEAAPAVAPIEEAPAPEETAEAVQPDDFAAYIDAHLGTVVVPPPPASTQGAGAVSVTATKLDLAAKDSKNRELGCNGELFVVEFERKRLQAAGRADLADQIKWVSQEVGDGLGYDVLSYTDQGQQLRIEVKTTNAGPGAPFYISANELDVWRSDPGKFRLYRVFDFAKGPKIFILEGDPDQILKLEALTYRARL